MILRSLVDSHSTHLAILLKDLGHIGPDQDLASCALYHWDDVVGYLTATSYWIVSSSSHEMSV